MSIRERLSGAIYDAIQETTGDDGALVGAIADAVLIALFDSPDAREALWWAMVEAARNEGKAA